MNFLNFINKKWSYEGKTEATSTFRVPIFFVKTYIETPNLAKVTFVLIDSGTF